MARKRKRRYAYTTRRRRKKGILTKMWEGFWKRRKKSKKKTPLLNINKGVMKEIWGVVHLCMAVLSFLSINGYLGVGGEYVNSMLRPVFGWGIYLIPALFLFCSLTLFLSRKLDFGLERLFGLMFFVISGLGILHLSVPMDRIFEFAQSGEYGGYIGFVSNFILRSGIGDFGSYVVYAALFLISFLMLFEVSFKNLWRYLTEMGTYTSKKSKAKKKKKDEKQLEAFVDEDFDEDIGELKIVKPEDESVKFDPTTTDTIVIKRVPESSKIEDIKRPKIKDWKFPPYSLLEDKVTTIKSDDKDLKSIAENIKEKLQQFKIDVTMNDVHVGPTVIQFTLKPGPQVKLSKITSLKNDLALALAAKSVRIEAPIPGKSLVGIEIPSDTRSTVYLKEIMKSKEFDGIDSKMKLPLGRDVSGKPIVADLKAMPHLLIAGATGAGKSVGMNTFLISLLYQNTPDELKFIMIDPKRVELKDYNGIPHLMTPVIIDPEKASIALRWAVNEMNQRYQMCADAGHRSIDDYNADDKVEEKMPRIVIVIDELADLMMTAGKEVEASICRLAQMARAVGMHLVIATQRPSVDVITGLIKANIPTRIAFTVTSSIDSRTILDSMGAEDLLGQGDMLFLPKGLAKPVRVQGIYVSSSEITRVTNHLKMEMGPDYNESITSIETAKQDLVGVPQSVAIPQDGSDQAVILTALQVIRQHRKASASLLQRKCKIGYARAARLLDELHDMGIIGPSNGAKPREISMERVNTVLQEKGM